jgi:hypothetical protein
VGTWNRPRPSHPPGRPLRLRQALPTGVPLLTATPVLDPGAYGKALTEGLMDRRPMFTAFDAEAVVWADGRRERVGAVIFATGYRPNLDCLQPLGALEHGAPKHIGVISTTHPGLAYTGLELQRSFSSNTLRRAQPVLIRRGAQRPHPAAPNP